MPIANPPRSPLVRGEVGKKPVQPPSPDKGRAGEGFSYLPYNKDLVPCARENRKNPTYAEQRIWSHVLRQRQLADFKFLRQKPIDNYIVDFYCSELKLVIEVDGDSHCEQVEYDEIRTSVLESLGLCVVRYTNNEVKTNLEGVADDLLRVVASLSLRDNFLTPEGPCQGNKSSPLPEVS